MKGKMFCIAALFPLLTFSQDKSSRVNLDIIGSVGVAAGQNSAKPLFQLESGISYGRWFSGIGVGLDYYNFGSIPLFADWRMNFGKARSGFVYANVGYNFPFRDKADPVDIYASSDRFYGGLYLDAGLGYSIRLNRLNRLLFSAGYSRKDINNKVTYHYPCGIVGTSYCPEQSYRYHYIMGRVIAKLSWLLGR